MIMKSKILATSLLGLLMVSLALPQISASETEELSAFNLRFFEFKTSINVSIDKLPTSPVEPSASFDIDIKVNLSYEIPKFFPKFLLDTKIGKWVLFRDKNHDGKVNVSLSVSTPDWCSYELKDKKENLTLDILSSEEVSTKLNITVNSNVPALEKGDIKITAKFTPEEKWGFKSSESSTNFSIVSKYVGNITANIEALEGLSEYTLEPGTNVTFPLNITNNYNGETKVMIELANKDDIEKINWTVEIENNEIVIPKGETKSTNITIKTSYEKGKEMLNLTVVLTPKSTSSIDIDDKYKIGSKIEYTLPTLVKAELVEEIEIDWYTIVIVLLVVVIVVLAILLIIKKKK